MSAPLLQVSKLTKHFPVGPRNLLGGQAGRLKAVDGVSFELERGTSLGLVGESGCGKSTTARAIVGLQPPTSGSIKLDGVELTGLSTKAWLPHRRRMQMVFQDPFGSLDPRQNAGSIIEEPLRVHRIGKPRERRLRVQALIEAVGLKPSQVGRYPHEFSGGQRQRIGIARALALEPDLIICDEPVSALDVSIQAQILNLMKQLQERFGLAYLFIAHDLAVVHHVCQRVAVMYLGRVVEIADRAALFHAPQHPYTKALLSAVPLPDPVAEAQRERILLVGDAPSPQDPPTGCSFHPRCPARSLVPGDRCRREAPQLTPRGTPGQFSSCHLEAHS
jgi:oligopeptide transport system ATP-binding protein